MATTLTQYLFSSEQISSGDNILWIDQSNSHGENLTLINSSYTNSSKKICVTDLFVGYFNYNDVSSFFETNPDLEISKIEYEVKYKVSISPGSESSDSVLDLYLSNISNKIDIKPDVIDNIYITPLDSGIKTAKFVFDSNVKGCPSVFQVNDDKFKIVLYISSNNPNESSILFEIYEVKQIITLSLLSIPNIRISTIDQDIENFISNSDLFNFGSFLNETIFYRTYIIKNTGSSDLVIDSIALSSNIGFSSELSFPFTVGSGSSVSFTITFSGSSLGTYDESLQIISNSNINSVFDIVFRYTIVSSSATPPLISVSYGSNIIQNNNISSLYSAPLNISKFIPLTISNIGSSNININSFSVVGDGTVGVGTDLSSRDPIAPNSSKTLNVLINTGSIGNKKINIVITSSEYQNNPLKLYFVYSVLPQISAFITDGSKIIDNDSNTNIGSLDRGKSFVKSYFLRNSGIYKTMIVNSISGDKDLSIIGNYSFPFTLMPNSANSLAFIVVFDTNSPGLKEGSFIINYDEGSVP